MLWAGAILFAVGLAAVAITGSESALCGRPRLWPSRALLSAGVAVLIVGWLAGCAALPTAIGIAAGVSTLLKNEANCSLAAMADCTMPHVKPPLVSEEKK